MPTVNVDVVLNTYAGEPLTEQGPDGKSRGLTLQSACCAALMATFPEDKDIGGTEKVRRYQLAQKIYANTSLDLPVEDIALLKKLIDRAYGPAVVGPAWVALDPPATA